MKHLFTALTLAALLFAPQVRGQISISALNTTNTQDFTGFAGTGFVPTPASGELDSDNFAVDGFSSPAASAFGATGTTGDLARGSDVGGGVSTGGVYSFDVGGGNVAWGVQPGGSDFTPGSFYIRYQNATGAAVSTFNLAYDIFVNNDTARGNSFNFGFVIDDCSTTDPSTLTYTDVASLDYTSPGASDANGFTQVARSLTNQGVSWPDTQCLVLRFRGNDSVGSGARDEFALDNVALTAVDLGQQVTLAFNPTSATVDEDAGTVNIPVVLSTSDGAPTGALVEGTVDLSGGTGTAADITDSPTAKTVSFPANTASGTTVNASYTLDDDALDEGVETLEFSLASTDADALGATTYTLTINDNDAITVVFSAAAGSVDEGSATSVDVVLNAPGGGQVGTAVSGDILIQGGTNADEINTFTASFSFAATATDGATETISIDTVDDSPLDDGPQDVTFAFDNLVGATAGTPSTFVLTVQDINGPQPGDLVITEFMADPSSVSDTAGEYIEVHNTTGSAIDLNGFVISDDASDSHTIASSVSVPSGGFAVLCRNSTSGTNGGVTCDYQYSGITLNNGSDAINLSDGGTRIARVSYSSGSGGSSGVAFELRALSLVAPDGVVRRSTRISQTGGRNRPFVDADASLSGGDFGSPGAFGNTASNVQAMTLGNIQGGGADANSDGTISGTENDAAAAGDIGWYLLSVPATDATIADLAGQNLVQGIDNYYDDDTQAANLLTDYDGTSFIEPGTDMADDQGAGGSISNSSAYEFVEGRGFLWFHYDNDLIPANATDNASNSVAMPYTLDLSARTAPSSNVTTTLASRSGGDSFYMLGNPFAGSFVLSGLTASGGGSLGDNIEVYDPFSDSYRTPLSISAGDTLAAFSGFFLTNSGAPAVEFSASSVTTGGVIFGRQDAPVQRRRLGFQLAGVNTDLGAETYDEAAVLQFHPLASEGEDLFDGSKLYPFTGIYGLIGLVGEPEDGPVLRSVESRPYDSGDFEIELDVQTSIDGTFTLTWPLQEDLPASWGFELTDRTTGTTIDLREVSAYTFTVSSAAPRITPGTLAEARQALPESLTATPSWTQANARATGARFVLRVTTNAVANEDDSLAKGYQMTAVYPNPFNPQAQFSLTLDQSQSVRAEVFDALGRRVAVLADGMQTAGTTTYRIDGQRLASGVYVVRVAGETFVETQRVTLVK